MNKPIKVKEFTISKRIKIADYESSEVSMVFEGDADPILCTDYVAILCNIAKAKHVMVGVKNPALLIKSRRKLAQLELNALTISSELSSEEYTTLANEIASRYKEAMTELETTKKEPVIVYDKPS